MGLLASLLGCFRLQRQSFGRLTLSCPPPLYMATLLRIFIWKHFPKFHGATFCPNSKPLYQRFWQHCSPMIRSMYARNCMLIGYVIIQSPYINCYTCSSRRRLYREGRMVDSYYFQVWPMVLYHYQYAMANCICELERARWSSSLHRPNIIWQISLNLKVFLVASMSFIFKKNKSCR